MSVPWFTNYTTVLCILCIHHCTLQSASAVGMVTCHLNKLMAMTTMTTDDDHHNNYLNADDDKNNDDGGMPLVSLLRGSIAVDQLKN